MQSKRSGGRQTEIYLGSDARAKEKELNGLRNRQNPCDRGGGSESEGSVSEASNSTGKQTIPTTLIEKYPDIVRVVAERISKIDRITVIDGGNGSQGAAKVANDASQSGCD